MGTGVCVISSAHGGLGCDAQGRRHEAGPRRGVLEQTLASGLVSEGLPLLHSLKWGAFQAGAGLSPVIYSPCTSGRLG